MAHLLPTVVVGAALLLASGQATNCPSLNFKTVDAECRWVMGRPVSCNSSCAPGTRAFYTCKPLYRLPLSLRETRRPTVDDVSSNEISRHPEVDDDPGMESSMCREDGNWSPLPFTCVPECGRLIGNGETLVVDGKPVNSPVEFPWHVAIYDRRYKGGITQICGGTLITTKFFVSAAHCFVTSSADAVLRPPSEFAAAVGKLNRNWSVKENYAQTRNVGRLHSYLLSYPDKLLHKGTRNGGRVILLMKLQDIFKMLGSRGNYQGQVDNSVFCRQYPPEGNTHTRGN